MRLTEGLKKIVKITAEAVKNTEQKDKKPADKAQDTKPSAAQNLWDDYGETVTGNLMATAGCSREEAESKTRNAIDYAAAIMEECDKADENGNKDVRITFDEWIEGNNKRLDYMGVTEDEGRKIFDAMNLDGDKGLSVQELIALNLFKDATNDKKEDKKDDDSLVLDNDLNVKTENKQNGSTTIAQNMKELATEDGKALFQDLYAAAFGNNAANIASMTKDLRNNLMENTLVDPGSEEYMSEEQVNSAVEAYTKYLTGTMESKDKDNSGKVTLEEWATDVTYSFMGLDKNKAADVRKMAQVFEAMDLDGDGQLDLRELATQYIYRDLTSGNPEDNENATMGELLDGNARDKDGMATNLTSVVNVWNNPDATDEEGVIFGRETLRAFGEAAGIYKPDEE